MFETKQPKLLLLIKHHYLSPRLYVQLWAAGSKLCRNSVQSSVETDYSKFAKSSCQDNTLNKKL